MVDVPDSWLSGPINADFVQRFLQGRLSTEECRYIGFREQIARPELIERTVLEVAGTVLTAQLAVEYGIASNVAGGTHHASPVAGAGYTILNDLAVATHVLTITDDSSNTKVNRVLVVDCDVHQGDGTAKFGDGLLKDKLFTLSLHCASNYPIPKAHSTFDVGLPDGMRDDDYMEVLERSVDHAISVTNPDLVLYDAGVDVYENDRLGRLKVTEQGIRKRDRWVLDRCVSAGIPVAAVVGGGYDKDVDSLARRHAIVHEECAYVWRKHRMWERVVVQ
jgi:acetoin utilization deacetylase AcuC-like enzyme